VRHVARMGERRSAYKTFVAIPKGKRSVWRLIRRWEDNIKIDHRETKCENVDGIHLAHDRVHWRAAVNPVMNLRLTEGLSTSQEELCSMDLLN